MDAITTAILEKGKYSADQKAVALAEAANSDNLGAVRALLRAGANFSMRISSVGGGTIGSALATASFHNEDLGDSEKIVAEMLASPKSRSVINDGWENESFGAPVHCASFNGNAGILRKLITAGATVNPPEDLREYDIATPLMSAASGIQPEAIKVLLGAGANACLVDVNGRNAIHHLAGSDSDMEEDEELPYLKQALEDLAAAGCDTKAEDDDANTPADIAGGCGREKFATLLETYTVEAKPAKAAKKKMKA